MPKILNLIKKNLIVILLLGVIFVLFGLYLFSLKEKNDLTKIINSVNSTSESKKIELNLTKLELAKNQAEQEEGLMYRMELCERCGMLFIFDAPQELSFWMKNTFLPLDIIFMSENGKILSIAKNATPLNQILRYHSNGKAKYALEVNAGFSEKNNLLVDDKIDVEKLLNSGVKYESSNSSQVELFI